MLFRSRAIEAAKNAIDSKLLETSINGAQGVIVNITGGPNLTLHEVTDAANIINNAILDDARVIIGAVVDNDIQTEVQITVIATGFELKANVMQEKASASKSLSAADFFSGAFNAPKKASNTSETAPSFGNIEIPDFLKK